MTLTGTQGDTDALQYIASVSSVDLIGPCFETQPKIHMLKISNAAWTVLSTHWVLSKQVTCWTAKRRAQS